jgi:hypothetical protein
MTVYWLMIVNKPLDRAFYAALVDEILVPMGHPEAAENVTPDRQIGHRSRFADIQSLSGCGTNCCTAVNE